MHQDIILKKSRPERSKDHFEMVKVKISVWGCYEGKREGEKE